MIPRQSDLLLRLTRSTSQGVSLARFASTRTRQSQQTTRDDDGDFRPPWVYSGSRFLTYTTIPLTLLYCTFLADWGEREHIFMPLRRWVSKQGQSILSVSPEEAALVRRNDERVSASTSLQGSKSS